MAGPAAGPGRRTTTRARQPEEIRTVRDVPGATKAQRADGRRNRARIIAAARDAVAGEGAHASLEHIARQAGVGSATLHRHFPSRQDLLEAVFHDHVERLCARAEQLGDQLPAGKALRRWLDELTVHTATTRGLATSLMRPDEPDGTGSTCYAMLRTAAAKLLSRGQRRGRRTGRRGRRRPARRGQRRLLDQAGRRPSSQPPARRGPGRHRLTASGRLRPARWRPSGPTLSPRTAADQHRPGPHSDLPRTWCRSWQRGAPRTTGTADMSMKIFPDLPDRPDLAGRVLVGAEHAHVAENLSYHLWTARQGRHQVRSGPTRTHVEAPLSVSEVDCTRCQKSTALSVPQGVSGTCWAILDRADFRGCELWPPLRSVRTSLKIMTSRGTGRSGRPGRRRVGWRHSGVACRAVSKLSSNSPFGQHHHLDQPRPSISVCLFRRTMVQRSRNALSRCRCPTRPAPSAAPKLTGLPCRDQARQGTVLTSHL